MTRKLIYCSSTEGAASVGNDPRTETLLADDRLPAWAKLTSYKPSGKLKHHIIPAATGFAFMPAAGSNFRVVDCQGQQVVDFMAWCLPNSTPVTNSIVSLPSVHELRRAEHFSASYTRYYVGGSATPIAGEHLYSNHGGKLFEVVEDQVKCNDLLFMACNPSFYDGLGLKGHRSCATNIAEAMNIWLGNGEGNSEINEKGKRRDESEVARERFQWHDVHDPFNIFQNTPYYTLKALENSRKGDFIELKALQRCVVALSSCPYAENGFNGGKITDVGVVWEE
jgi:uncharacterized protein